MQLSAASINGLWWASNLPAWIQFQRALRRPRLAQRALLHSMIRASAGSQFGRAHGFDGITDYQEFARRVPPGDGASIAEWTDRIRAGGENVLCREPVTHLIPTSGTVSGRKLIPFTAGLQRQFNAAIAPWMVDLMGRNPSLACGQAYWSVSPALDIGGREESVVPIGFESDTVYLGGAKQRLAEKVMAVPSNVQRAASIEKFRYGTLLHLLRCRELRLISVWHPSFLTLLMEDLPVHWGRLLGEISSGGGRMHALPRRAKELENASPAHPASIWPHLRLLSCWCDAAAALPARALAGRFPGAVLQPKGLVSTESFVSIPFQGKHPVTVASHFYEFMDDEGRIYPIERIRHDGEYEVMVTTAGGLWRYRTGDRIRVTGWVCNTPSVEFLGRIGGVSDLFGEKLDEAFVAGVLRGIFVKSPPLFAMLAPDDCAGGMCYTLYVEGAVDGNCADRLDDELRRNPHYAYCRDLGQLRHPRLFQISDGGYLDYTRRVGTRGARLGDIKPSVMSKESGWSDTLRGAYQEDRVKVRGGPAGAVHGGPAW